MSANSYQNAVRIGKKWLKQTSKCAFCEFFLAEQSGSATNRAHSTRFRRTSAYDASIAMPHMSRFVLSQEQPAFVRSVWAGIRRSVQICLVGWGHTPHLVASVDQMKGTLLWSKRHGSSQQSLPSPSRAAWNLTLSAPLLVPLQAPSQLTRLVRTRQQLHLLVPLLACFATTLASAARPTNRCAAPDGRTSQIKRRRGFAPAAFLRSKDPAHV